MESTSKKTALITGCSKDSIGDALAREFHRRGYQVIATARTLSKIEHLQELGIQTVELEVTSAESIEKLRLQVSSLDILINNAGQIWIGPFADCPMSELRDMFEVNFFSVAAITQAFLPLLIQSKGIIVNQGSVNSQMNFPACSGYGATKAALHALSDVMRVELAPLGIRVVYLVTGTVQSNITMKQMRDTPAKIAPNSIYSPIRKEFEHSISGAVIRDKEQNTDEYARQVISDLLDGWMGTPKWIWRGTNVTAVYILWLTGCFWKGLWDLIPIRVAGLHLLGERIKATDLAKNK